MWAPLCMQLGACQPPMRDTGPRGLVAFRALSRLDGAHPGLVACAA